MKKPELELRSTKSLDATIFELNRALEGINQKTGFDALDDISQRILFFVGMMVSANEPCCIGDVVKRRRFGTPPTVFARLSKLEHDEWVATETDPSDRRSKLLSLTAKSKRAFNKMSQHIRGLPAED